MAIESDNHISIRASLSYSESKSSKYLKSNISNISPASPIQSLGLLSGNDFRLLIIGIDDNHQEIYRKEYDSDSFGNFEIRFLNTHDNKKVSAIQAYEISTCPGMELLIGTFIPIKVKSPKKVVISDFDKTLVDTKFSTPKEMYESLRRPLNYFPKIDSSIDMLKNYIKDGYRPFILSASPHFYENAIRDWLYQNEIYTGNIILKDYRKVFSLFEGDLTPKDLKSQGFYKLSSLVSIILMTGVPDELILMGDGFETDPLIYVTLSSVLRGDADPWQVWNSLKQKEGFKLTTKQQSRFLTKFYRLSNLAKEKRPKDISIHIRCNQEMREQIENKTFSVDFLNQFKSLISYYTA
jgi:phosphatidate phosphatase APP1